VSALLCACSYRCFGVCPGLLSVRCQSPADSHRPFDLQALVVARAVGDARRKADVDRLLRQGRDLRHCHIFAHSCSKKRICLLCTPRVQFVRCFPITCILYAASNNDYSLCEYMQSQGPERCLDTGAATRDRASPWRGTCRTHLPTSSPSSVFFTILSRVISLGHTPRYCIPRVA
jgi:hypothetical protein